MKLMRNKKGLTLIECLVSVVVLGIGIVGVVGCLTAALLTNQKASHLELATSIAQDTIEDMRSKGFGAITYDEFPATADSTQVPDLADLHQGVRNITIAPNYRGDTRLIHVSVEVAWRGAGATTPHVVMETVITNRNGHTGG